MPTNIILLLGSIILSLIIALGAIGSVWINFEEQDGNGNKYKAGQKCRN